MVALHKQVEAAKDRVYHAQKRVRRKNCVPEVQMTMSPCLPLTLPRSHSAL